MTLIISPPSFDSGEWARLKESLQERVRAQELNYFRHLVFSEHKNTATWLPDPVFPDPRPEKVMAAVGKVVWTLWKDNPGRIWALICSWSSEPTPLSLAGRSILEAGLVAGHLSFELAFETLESWILGENGAKQRAAAQLLPPYLAALPQGQITNLAEKWVDQQKAERLRSVVESLLDLDPMRGIRFITTCCELQGSLKGILIPKQLVRMPVPRYEAAHDYQNLESQIKRLMVVVSGHSRVLTKDLQRFLQRTRTARSKLKREFPGEKSVRRRVARDPRTTRHGRAP